MLVISFNKNSIWWAPLSLILEQWKESVNHLVIASWIKLEIHPCFIPLRKVSMKKFRDLRIMWCALMTRDSQTTATWRFKTKNRCQVIFITLANFHLGLEGALHSLALPEEIEYSDRYIIYSFSHCNYNITINLKITLTLYNYFH